MEIYNEETTKKVAKKINYSKYGYMYIAPFFIVYLLFNLIPLLFTFYLSVSDVRGFTKIGDSSIIGFENYLDIFKMNIFWEALGNTVIIWILNYIPQIGMAFILAKWFTDLRLRIKAAGIFRAFFYMPNIITAATVAMLFFSLFAYPFGPMNQLYGIFGLDPKDFLNDVWIARIIIAFIQFWMWYGQTLILLMAGIMAISPSLYEAAMIDGATSGQMFRKITLPLLKPIMLFILVTSLIGGMQMFDIPWLLTKGGPDYKTRTIMVLIYEQAFGRQGGGQIYNRSAAMSVILFFIVLAMSIGVAYLMKENKTKGKNGAKYEKK